MEILQKEFRAPELYGDYWFNAEPMPIAALRGSVILIDFWDYTSMHSLRAIPYVQEWFRRYREMGLRVVGVHTPEFPFGRDPMNVRAAIERLGVRHPVVMDNELLIWSAYRNTHWPTKYLIDKNGFIRFLHAGEGSYQNFEHSIQSLLAETGVRDEFPLVMEPLREEDRPGAVCFRATPEIFTGWQRGTIGNLEGYAPESTVHYEDPGYYVEGRLYLQGNWLSDRNFVRLDEEGGREGYLILSFQAKEMNAVIKPEGESNFQVFVQQDQRYLTPENRGEDIRIDDEGRSFLLADNARLYNIVRNPEYGEHTVKLSSRSNGFALFAVSFVSCVIPELISKN